MNKDDIQVNTDEQVLEELAKEAHSATFYFLNIAVVLVFVLTVGVSFFVWTRPDTDLQGKPVKAVTQLNLESFLSGDFTETLSENYKKTIPFSDDFRKMHNIYLKFTGVGGTKYPDIDRNPQTTVTTTVPTEATTTEPTTRRTTQTPYQPPIIVTNDTYDTDPPVTEETTTEETTTEGTTTETTTEETTTEETTTEETTTSVSDDDPEPSETTTTPPVSEGEIPVDSQLEEE